VKAQTYTVQKGDSLSKIAKETYGDASKWRALFEANKDSIKNPDLIYPGQVLTIPPAQE
jgi:nucleoid-associated protein YgaU